MQLQTLLLKLLESLKEKKIEPNLPILTPNLPIMETNQEKLGRLAVEGLDTDVSPEDLAQDEVGCANSVSDLIKRVLPDFPIILGTSQLFWKLHIDKRFKLVTTPSKGCIIISPTVGGTIGHTGIFITAERIASNNSNTGLFQGNYNWPDSWIATFGSGGRGLHSYIFAMV